MKSQKILIAGVVVLVVLNCTLLGIIWLGRPMHSGGPPQQASEFLSKELKLNAKEKKAYDLMREEHFTYTRQLNDANRKLRDAFFEHINTPKLDTAAIDSIEKQLSINQALLDKATLEHFRRLRAMLNKEQQEKFDKIIQSAVRMMGGPPRGGREMRGDDRRMPPPPGTKRESASQGEAPPPALKEEGPPPRLREEGPPPGPGREGPPPGPGGDGLLPEPGGEGPPPGPGRKGPPPPPGN